MHKLSLSQLYFKLMCYTEKKTYRVWSVPLVSLNKIFFQTSFEVDYVSLVMVHLQIYQELRVMYEYLFLSQHPPKIKCI